MSGKLENIEKEIVAIGSNILSRYYPGRTGE
jgi:hypothetical protein